MLVGVTGDGEWGANGAPPLARAVGALTRFGDVLPGGGYVIKQQYNNPVVWAGLLKTAAGGQSGYQWVVADLLVDGARWEGVEAVDLMTGQAADLERCGSGDPQDAAVVPFSYEQVLAEIEGVASRSTQGVWMAVARRFPLDPNHPRYRHKLEWSAALFSHYVALVAADLPDWLLDECLRRAGRPASEGGYSVADVGRRRDAYYRTRDGESTAAAAEGVEVVGGGKGLSYRDAQRSYGGQLATFMVARVPGMPRDAADNAAYAVLWWLYHEAGPELLAGARSHDDQVPLNLTGDAEL